VDFFDICECTTSNIYKEVVHEIRIVSFETDTIWLVSQKENTQTSIDTTSVDIRVITTLTIGLGFVLSDYIFELSSSVVLEKNCRIVVIFDIHLNIVECTEVTSSKLNVTSVVWY